MAQVGAHVSISGGVFNAPINAQKEKLETFQMFTRSPRTFACPKLTDEMVEQFHANVQELGFKQYYIHAPYLVNLGSPKARTRNGSITILRQELERGTRLGVTGVMFHTGSAKDQPDRATAIKTAKQSLNKVLDGYKGTCKLLLENAAGSGEVLGCTFEELADLASGVKKTAQKHVGFCLDTQHAFGSGYDMRTKQDVDNLVKVMHKTINLKNLIVVQVNDSKVPFDSKKDRHEHIDAGEIGKAGFGFLINHSKLQHLDYILETKPEGRAKDVKILKSLRT